MSELKKETKQTTREDELWRTIRALNDCWTKDDGTGLVDFFHENMVAITPVDLLRREGRDACVAGWVGFAAMAKIYSWKEIDPKIQLFGTTAIVTYYYELDCEMSGRRIVLSGRDMFVLIKESGRWWAVANQFSPYPG